MLKLYTELRKEIEEELVMTSALIKRIENQVDNDPRDPREIEQKKARLAVLAELYQWQTELEITLETNGKFGKEQNNQPLHLIVKGEQEMLLREAPEGGRM